MNLSERLAKAAMERASANRAQVTRMDQSPTDPRPESTSAFLPDRVDAPVDSAHVVVMKMRLPDPTTSRPTPDATSTLPLWERPLIDVLRETALATVTSLPVARFDENGIDDDQEGTELARTIPMPGSRMASSDIEIDDAIDLRDEIRLPCADDEHTCPHCGARASIDIHDPMRGRIHLSCESCFKMWQQQVEQTVHSDEPFMRD